MQTIDLECPQCQTMLELDAGFAGGVCRCSNCGTLMTVPSDPRRERAETLTRPDRPDSPGGSTRSRASSASSSRRGVAPPPSKPASRPTETPASKTPAPASPASPPSKSASSRPTAPTGSVPPPSAGAALPQAATPAKDSSDTQTFVTASGKTVRVSTRIAIPTARKKREVVRFSVVLVFLLMGIVVIAVCIVAINALSGPSDSGPNSPVKRADPNDAIGGYDPDVNPLLRKIASYLGLPYSQRTILVIDAAPITSQWRPLAIDAIVPGLGNLPKDKALQVMLITEHGTLSHPKEPRHISIDDRAELTEFFANAGPPGSAPPTAALRAALDAKPSRVVFVTGNPPDKSSLAAMADLLADTGGVKVDAIVIETDSPELRAIIEKAGGKFISFPRGVILRWLKEYDAEKEKEADAAKQTATTGGDSKPEKNGDSSTEK